MMGGGEFKSSLLQQMMWSGGTDSKNMMSSLMPWAEEQEASNKIPPCLSSSSMLLPQHLLQISSGHQLAPEVNSTATSLATSSDLHDERESDMPESWSQLLLGGLVGDHERYSAATALLSKGLEEGPMPHQAAAAYNLYGHAGGEEIQQTSGTNKSQVSQMLLASSPRSCVTTSLSSNMLDFSNSTAQAPEVKNHHSDNSSEGNSTASGSAPKKARVQTSSSAQSTLKVRKERLGDRITALHQIVSPFGKTDTASVLQETIGYIRFLLGHIETLSFPYLGLGGHGNENSIMQQHTVATLLNHSTSNGMVEAAEAASTQQLEEVNGGGDDEGSNKDLRSRGLCLVPVSCTSHLAGDDSGASDFWAVAAAPPPPPPQLGGIIWR
ncbi:transcription factor bHLH68-like isoform X1 [Panicum miliaceum]|uniref:Transcription factor bHLH68-like isoform X1 n=1 Tax=Panicum miliaceum TaxID=4540 RepID=A0A3L6SJ64_PANMI|nr:transcription factor bHLH68-like isoform X1 [Panicum miliaceum]